MSWLAALGLFIALTCFGLSLNAQVPMAVALEILRLVEAQAA